MVTRDFLVLSGPYLGGYAGSLLVLVAKVATRDFLVLFGPYHRGYGGY